MEALGTISKDGKRINGLYRLLETPLVLQREVRRSRIKEMERAG